MTLRRNGGLVLSRLSAAGVGRILPLGVAATWWAACFILYASDWPIAYSHRNILGVSALMAGTLACAIAGYRVGVGGKYLEAQQVAWKLPIPITVGFIATLVLIIPLTQTYSGYSIFDLGKALADQAAAYSRSTQRIAEGFGARGALVVLETLLAPLTMSVVPFLALSWFEARKRGVLLLLALAAPTYLGVLTGRSVEIGISGVVICGAWLLSRVRRRMPLRRIEAAAIVLVALTLLAAFGAQKLARTAGSAICLPGSDVCIGRHTNFVESTWVIFASYASQGLEGLGHALDAKWTFGGGLSHSVALQSFLVRTFHVHTAAVVTSQLHALGWSDTGYWSTALTSIANDVPWPLVPLVIGVQAAVLGSSWRLAVQRADWLSVSVFCYTWLALLFIPQNLQLAISGPTYVGYVLLVFCYLVRPLMVRHSETISEHVPFGQAIRRIGSRKNE
jgi:hypothetical protein